MTVRVLLLACLTLVCGFTLALSIPEHHVLHEKRGTLHPRWNKRGRVPEHKRLPMRIGLTQSNLDGAYDLLMDVYVFLESSTAQSYAADERIAQTQHRQIMADIGVRRK